MLGWHGLLYFKILPSLTFPSVNTNTLQAVFLDNGLIYFGKLKEVNRDYVALDEAYYLRTNTQTPNDGGLNLVRVIDDLHRPENTIYISKTKITFWENLQVNSPVLTIIKQQTSKGQSTTPADSRSENP